MAREQTVTALLAMQAMAKLHAVGYREDDVYLHCAPLFHIGGLSSMLAMLAVGATQVGLHTKLHCERPGAHLRYQDRSCIMISRITGKDKHLGPSRYR